MARFVLMIVCVLACAASGTAAAQERCDIDDIVFLVQREKLSSAQVQKRCGNVVIGAGTCSLTRIVRLASNDSNDADDIRDECSARGSDVRPQQGGPRQSPGVARMCQTPYGGCPMAMAVPVNSSCYCVTPMGPAWGVAR